MKNFLLIACVLILPFSWACKKDRGCTPLSPTAEEPKILEYLSNNTIDATKVGNGIYYKILDSGFANALYPSRNSKVTVTYSGKLLDNTVFDASTSPKTYALSDVIEGWQICLPYLKKGGRMLLFIPSAYAYGCTGNSNFNVPVPSNSVLIYDVRLIEID